LLAEQLCHVDALDESIARLSQEIAQRLRPFAAEVTRLQTIPGVGGVLQKCCSPRWEPT
jgi:transposase